MPRSPAIAGTSANSAGCAPAAPEPVCSCRCSVSGIQSRKSPSAEIPTAPTISRASPRSACRRRHVAARTENVLTIPLAFDARQALVAAWPVGRAHASLPFVADEVEVDRAGGEPTQILAEGARPADHPLFVRRVLPEGEGVYDERGVATGQRRGLLRHARHRAAPGDYEQLGGPRRQLLSATRNRLDGLVGQVGQVLVRPVVPVAGR